MLQRGLVITGATVGLAGCLGGGSAVSILAAGSLQNALADGLQSRTAHRLEVEAHGSARVARMVAADQRDPAIVALADPQLFATILDASWYALFASNAVVLAYNEGTAGGQAVGAAEPWFEPFVDDGSSSGGDRTAGITLGRTDPELDPLGYRTLFALRLAADHYDRPGLPEAVLAHARRFPETQVLARFETGSVDAAFVYRNMAVERDYPFRALPEGIDLSEPGRAGTYETVRYSFADGTTVTGAPIEYAARLRTDGGAAREVFSTLVDQAHDYLDPHGFTVAARHPTYTGDVPPALRD